MQLCQTLQGRRALETDIKTIWRKHQDDPGFCEREVIFSASGPVAAADYALAINWLCQRVPLPGPEAGLRVARMLKILYYPSDLPEWQILIGFILVAILFALAANEDDDDE